MLGLIVGGVVTKDKPLGRRGVRWHAVGVLGVALNGSPTFSPPKQL